MAFCGALGREQFQNGAGSQCFPDRLRALGKKTPGLAPRGPSGETACGCEPGVL
jgi:hypothetical protein